MPTENLAVSRADRLYCELLLDTVAVVEVGKDQFVNVVYKRIRTCKHTNIQFVLTTTGVHPVCQNSVCGLVFTPIIEEGKEDEKGRCNLEGDNERSGIDSSAQLQLC